MPKVTSFAAATVAQVAANLAVTAATGGAAADVEVGLQIFQELDPPIQHALAALFHKLHHAKQAGTPKPSEEPSPPVVSSDRADGSTTEGSGSEVPEGATPGKESLLPEVPDNF